MENSEAYSNVNTEESLVWVCPLNEERGFVAYIFSEGNNPRCRLVGTNVRKEERRKKPPTNLGPRRHCSQGHSDFSLGISPLSS